MGQSDGRSDGLSESYQRLNGSWLYCQLAFWQTFSHILFLPIFPSSMFGGKGKVIVGDKRNHYCQCYFIIGPFGTDMGSVIANGGLQLSNDESLRRAE